MKVEIDGNTIRIIGNRGVDFRFRLWDAEEKRMVYFELIEIVREMGRDLYDRTDVFHAFNGRESDVMQYTGLKDRKGKEIYEGDIVKNNFTSAQGRYLGHKWIVTFGEYSDAALEYGSSGHIGFFAKCIDPVNPEDQEQPLYGLPFDNHPLDLEVIGNIYENPELLKNQAAR